MAAAIGAEDPSMELSVLGEHSFLSLLYSDTLLGDISLGFPEGPFPCDADGNQLSLDSPNIFDYMMVPNDRILSPTPFEYNENIEKILKFLEEDQQENLGEELEMTLSEPENTCQDPAKSTQYHKRDLNPADANSADTMKPKRQKRGPRANRALEKKKRGWRKSCRHDQGEAQRGIPASRPGVHIDLPIEKGVASSPAHPVHGFVTFTLPISSLSAAGNTTLTAGGSLATTPAPIAFQVIQNFTAPQQVFNIPVANAVHPGGPTFVIVPAAPVSSPRAAGTPSSPVAGTVVDAAVARHPASPSSPASPSAVSVNRSSSPDSLPSTQPTTTDAATSPCRGSLRSLKTPAKPKSVEEFKESLRSYLLDTCQFMCAEDQVSLESLHIDVPLIQRQIKIKTGKNANKCLEKELIIFDVAERRRAEIPLSQIFHPNGERPKDTRVIALLGKAGLGKSTLIQKLCQDWSRGHFQQFELVFWFACKRLNLSGKRFGLRNLLFSCFAALPPANANEVFRYLLRNPEKVLIIFDGFDDFQDCEGLLHSPATSSSKEIYSIKDLFSGLFQKKLLIGSTVLVTARPKEKFNQFLGKVDKIVELSGFTPEHIELYMTRYFKGTSYCDGAWKKVQNNGFLFSLCSTPLICRLVCFLLEHYDMNKDLPSTLTGLYCHVFYHKMHVNAYAAGPVNRKQKQNVPDLGVLAWEGVQEHKCLLNPRDLSSEELKELGLSSGILSPHPVSECGEEDDFSLGFVHLITQNFLGALHLILAKNINGKSLVKQVLLEKKKKKPEEDWLDMLRRFLAGLLFQPAECSYLDCLSAKAVVSKKDALSEYLKKIKPSDLNPNRLLELCHCVYETGNTGLMKHMVSKLPAELSFRGTPLSLPDVFVLQHLLNKTRRAFALDLHETGIDLGGLKQLVGQKSVTSFRASISDTISLWEHLHQTGEHGLLKDSISKFTINPFKASRISDVEHLCLLVQIYQERKLPSCDSETGPGNEIFEIPAVEGLQKLEFALGPVYGSVGFLKLVEILPAFQWLQHLDLEALTDNKIGDTGVERLTEAFPALSSLETLNLSQNYIGDRGAERLAQSLPSLVSLKQLSLYSNLIGDRGAENMARALPEMKSLTELDVKYNKITDVGAQKLTESLKSCLWIKSLAMWNQSIPHGVLEHLKQQDSRINLL
ncbi:MHC class II transactivator-like isoform X1 [Polyodon spathula]|uniref:MHC class II transactivator-like isoform X1 n=2 Tax=Polyodon spathula TaxID=7913 RepID=UPI001B7F51F0|nr:MHC class II transactivator-like isoform X1 [Polyodon spathula]